MGNGIGLVSAKSWIEKWKGKLSISSLEGEGTTILIELPKAISKVEFRAKLSLRQGLTGIVIVDDERHVAESFAQSIALKTEVFDSISSYVKWLGGIDDPLKYLHVFDLHLKHGSGLDLIEMSPWKEQCVLYTFDSLNPEARLKAKEWGVSIMPKDFIKGFAQDRESRWEDEGADRRAIY